MIKKGIAVMGILLLTGIAGFSQNHERKSYEERQERKLKMLEEKLELTPGQSKEIQAIMQANKEAHKELEEQMKALHERKKELRDQEREKMKSVLNEEQLERLEEMKMERKERMRARHEDRRRMRKH